MLAMAEPTYDYLDEARRPFMNQQIDGFIVVGGGSALDLGKALSLLIRKTMRLRRCAAAKASTCSAGEKTMCSTGSVAASASAAGRCSPSSPPTIPLNDPAVIDEVVEVFLSAPEAYDYISNNHPPTWQDGQEVEVIRAASLEQAWRESDRGFQREHVTPYIWDQPARYRLANVARPDDAWYHRYRWTLDYPADYAFVKAVYERLYPTQPDFGTAELMALVDSHPVVHEINAGHKGSVWFDQHLQSLQTVDRPTAAEGVKRP